MTAHSNIRHRAKLIECFDNMTTEATAFQAEQYENENDVFKEPTTPNLVDQEPKRKNNRTIILNCGDSFKSWNQYVDALGRTLIYPEGRKLRAIIRYFFKKKSSEISIWDENQRIKKEEESGICI